MTSSFRSTPGAGIALLAIIAIVVVGCSQVRSPRSWVSSAELVSGGTMTVAVRDESGRIDAAEIDPPGVTAQDGVTNPAGEPGVLLVAWVGGACDDRTDVGIAGTGEELTVTITPTVSTDSCDAIGIRHTLRLTSPQPLPASAVTVRNERDATG